MIAMAIVIAAAGACERPAPPPPAVCLTVLGEGPLAVGDSIRATAGLIDSDRSCLSADPRELTWRASDTTILEVRGDGWVFARAPGVATLTVRTERRRRDETIEVIPAVDSIVVEGPGRSLAIGDTTRIHVAVHFRDGNVRRDVDVAWSLRSTGVLSDHFREPELIRARIALPAGYLVRATGPGDAWVVAEVRHHADSLPIHVRP